MPPKPQEKQLFDGPVDGRILFRVVRAEIVARLGAMFSPAQEIRRTGVSKLPTLTTEQQQAIHKDFRQQAKTFTDDFLRIYDRNCTDYFKDFEKDLEKETDTFDLFMFTRYACRRIVLELETSSYESSAFLVYKQQLPSTNKYEDLNRLRTGEEISFVTNEKNDTKTFTRNRKTNAFRNVKNNNSSANDNDDEPTAPTERVSNRNNTSLRKVKPLSIKLPAWNGTSSYQHLSSGKILYDQIVYWFDQIRGDCSISLCSLEKIVNAVFCNHRFPDPTNMLVRDSDNNNHVLLHRSTGIKESRNTATIFFVELEENHYQVIGVGKHVGASTVGYTAVYKCELWDANFSWVKQGSEKICCGRKSSQFYIKNAVSADINKFIHDLFQ